jgi:hypothetical protein
MKIYGKNVPKKKLQKAEVIVQHDGPQVEW